MDLTNFIKDSGSKMVAVFEYNDGHIKLDTIQSIGDFEIPERILDFNKKESLTRKNVLDITKALGFKKPMYDSDTMDDLISNMYPLNTIEYFSKDGKSKTIILYR